VARTAFLALSSLFLALASVPAVADSPWYVSLDAGTSKYAGLDVSGGPLFVGTGSTNVSSSDSATAFRLAAGYHLTPYLTAEMGYANLGDVSTSKRFDVPCEGSEGQGICFIVNTDNHARTSGYIAALTVQSADLAGWSIYGRAGIFIGHTHFSNFDDNVATVPIENTTHETGLTYGLGIAYGFSPHLMLRLGADRYPARFVNSTEVVSSTGTISYLDQEFHVNTVSLGLVYTF